MLNMASDTKLAFRLDLNLNTALVLFWAVIRFLFLKEKKMYCELTDIYDSSASAYAK